jgi:ferredoxin
MSDTQPQMLVVDMVRCDGHGICAFAAARLIRLDEWGYPLIDGAPLLTRRSRWAAQRAIRACPKRALSLITAPVPASAT